MKKIIIIFLSIFILGACAADTSSVKLLKSVPNNVEKHIDNNLTLQLITIDEQNAYITFQSEYEVDVALKNAINTVMVSIKESGEATGTKQPHVFKIDYTHDYDIIEAIINGELTPFDNVSAL